MKKFIALFLATILLTVAVTVPAMAEIGTENYVQLVHFGGNSVKSQIINSYKSIKIAVDNASSGDVIEIFGNITESTAVTIPDNMALTVVSGTKRVNRAIFGEEYFEYTDPNATTRTVKKGFDGSLFTLGENSNVTFQNITLDGNGKSGTKGGLIYAKSGAKATFLRDNAKSGVSFIGSVLGDGSFGGAIFAEAGAEIQLKTAVFSANSASYGTDIFLMRQGDLTAEPFVTANIRVCGDVNGDQNIGIVDLVRLKKVLLNNALLTDDDAPDIDCNGTLAGEDLIEMRKLLLSAS